jgi:hypothetical protein
VSIPAPIISSSALSFILRIYHDYEAMVLTNHPCHEEWSTDPSPKKKVTFSYSTSIHTESGNVPDELTLEKLDRI